MRDAFDVPEDDVFMTITEHDDLNFIHGTADLGILRDDDMVMIPMTVSATRSIEQKQALFARVAARLSANLGVRPENIFINLVEVRPENWSFGQGFAQYAMETAPVRM